jgi:acyl-CoA hydrolase
VPEIDWGRWLRPCDRIVASHMSAEPAALLASLAASTALPQPLHVLLGVPYTEAAAGLPPFCELTTFGGMGSAGTIARRRPIAVSPIPYSRCERLYEVGAWSCDVALVSLARSPDGRLFLGPSHGPVLAAARRARHVIAQVSANAPCLPGAEWPQEVPLAHCLDADAGPCVVADLEAGAVENAIAARVADLVEDGACLQVGIGALPSAMLAALSGHRHLGIHTGILTDALHRLVTSGVADGSRKTVDAGVAVTGSVSGTPGLYAALRAAPGPVVLRNPSRTHDAALMAEIDNLVCLNSAIEVDLLGNVNAEAVVDAQGRWRWVGGVGGLPDFVRGARASRGGRLVVALPSRTPRGQPRIVARLSGPCTVPAWDADVVVTEHGVAHLRDLPLGERVRRMLTIAHPDDAEALHASAWALGLG